MGTNYNHIRRNVLGLVVAIVVMCAALGGSLAWVVSTLNATVRVTKTQLAPMKDAMRSFAVVIGESFSAQSEVISSRSVIEVERVTPPQVLGARLKRELGQLHELIGRSAAQQERFEQIDAHINVFVRQQEEHRRAVLKTHELRSSFEGRWLVMQRHIQTQSVMIHRLNGVTRLEYMAALHQADNAALSGGASIRPMLLKITRGQDRALSEQLPRLELLQLELMLVLRELASCQDLDKLNSLVANKLGPVGSELERAYQVLDHRIEASSEYRALFDELYKAHEAFLKEAISDSPGSLSGLMRQILQVQEQQLKTQSKVKESAQLLSEDLGWTQDAVTQAFVSTDRRSGRDVSQAMWLALLSGVAGMLACVVALLRTRLAVKELDETNQTLQGLSKELGQMNATLEHKVEVRTEDLNERNRAMRLVMDHVDQGLLTVDLEGRLAREHSAVVEQWLGVPEEGETFAGYVSRGEPMMRGWLELGMESISDGFLPLEVALDQFPKQLDVGGRTLKMIVTPIVDEDQECERLLVILSDVTLALRQREAEEHQRELLTIFEMLSFDRVSFLGFFQDAQQLLVRLDGGQLSGAELYRAIHTLKGNAGIFGLNSVAALCHELEDRFNEEALAPGDFEQLNERWQQLEESLERLLGSSQELIMVEPVQYQLLMQKLEGGLAPSAAVEVLKGWVQEPFAKRLEHVAEQAMILGERLGKGGFDVVVEADQSRHDAELWRTFWNVFIHVIRNAIDHGLEDERERELTDKVARPKLRLSVEGDDDGLRIVVEDDGRGIDWERLRAKAKAKGMAHQSHEDLVEALFSDGVSTRDEVSQISGRGVGMGAVKEEVERLGGVIEVESEPGYGTRFSFVFAPMSSWRGGSSGGGTEVAAVRDCLGHVAC